MVGGVIFLGAMLVGDPFNGLAALALLGIGVIGRAAFTRAATPP
jgi:hypothetical protein